MSSYRLQKLAGFMASAAMSSANGSKDLACELTMADPLKKHSRKATLASGPADTQEHISGFGTLEKHAPSSMGCDTHGPFSIRRSGNIGQEILDQDGKIIAWTTDPWVAQVICKLLTDNEGLLMPS